MSIPSDPCLDCGGSGEERIVANPHWPSGSEPHLVMTGEPCSSCDGTGKERAIPAGDAPAPGQPVKFNGDGVST